MLGIFGMMPPPNGKLNKSLITPEMWDIFDRYKIDPNEYIVHSGLIQVDELFKRNNLSKDDRIAIAKWSVDIEIQLMDAEKNMLDTLTKMFQDNPILEVHKMNFPIMSEYAMEYM